MHVNTNAHMQAHAYMYMYMWLLSTVVLPGAGVQVLYARGSNFGLVKLTGQDAAALSTCTRCEFP